MMNKTNFIQNIMLGLCCVMSSIAFASESSDSIIAGYKDACGDDCAQEIVQLSRYAAKQCNLSFDQVVEESVELTGLQMIAIASAVRHPLTSNLRNYALQSINCNSLSEWSKSIQEYSLVLEKNNGLGGQ